jgi:hypothetical protein
VFESLQGCVRLLGPRLLLRFSSLSSASSSFFFCLLIAHSAHGTPSHHFSANPHPHPHTHPIRYRLCNLKMVDESLREITLEEVSKHNKTDDCWLIIGNANNGRWLMTMAMDANVVTESRNIVGEFLSTTCRHSVFVLVLVYGMEL